MVVSATWGWCAMWHFCEMYEMKNITKSIEFSKVQLMLSIGVHEWERKGPQKLLVSLCVRINENMENDVINNTLDYDQIYYFLKNLEKSDHFDLQETVCRNILDYICGIDGVEHVTVSTRKPDIFADAGYVGLTMSAQP